LAGTAGLGAAAAALLPQRQALELAVKAIQVGLLRQLHLSAAAAAALQQWALPVLEPLRVQVAMAPHHPSREPL
jgi:hypothetical protein